MAHDEGCPVPHRLEVRLTELRSRRRRLAIEAPIGVAVSAAAGYMVGIAATAPSNLLVASLAVFALLGPGAVGFLHRLTDLLAADCPSCGELFFYSPERMLFSFPLLHGRCASCDVPLGARFGRRAS